MKLGVGTNAVESESWKLSLEKMSGPTGHRLLNDRKCESQGCKELNGEDSSETSVTQCWRDPKIVRKLLAMRKKVVGEQLRRARNTMANMMKSIAKIQGKKEAGLAWKSVRDVRSKVWKEEQARVVMKINHLTTRSKNCKAHNRCRELDQLWTQRNGLHSSGAHRQQQQGGDDVADKDQSEGLVTWTAQTPGTTPRGQGAQQVGGDPEGRRSEGLLTWSAQSPGATPRGQTKAQQGGDVKAQQGGELEDNKSEGLLTWSAQTPGATPRGQTNEQQQGGDVKNNKSEGLLTWSAQSPGATPRGQVKKQQQGADLKEVESEGLLTWSAQSPGATPRGQVKKQQQGEDLKEVESEGLLTWSAQTPGATPRGQEDQHLTSPMEDLVESIMERVKLEKTQRVSNQQGVVDGGVRGGMPRPGRAHNVEDCVVIEQLDNSTNPTGDHMMDGIQNMPNQVLVDDVVDFMIGSGAERMEPGRAQPRDGEVRIEEKMAATTRRTNLQDQQVKPRQPYMDKTMDLEQVEMVKKASMNYNRTVTKNMQRSRLEGITVEESGGGEILTYGDVNLTEDEINLLRLGPGFMVVKPLVDQDMRIESTVALTKIRWDKMKSGSEELTGKQLEEEENEKSEDEVRLQDAIQAEARDVLNDSGSKLDMRRRRATDMNGNRKVYMPGPSKPIVEAEYSMRSSVWQKEFLAYKSENCDPTGKQKTTNLNRSQEIGLKSLSRKIAKLELLVLEADKGKRFVIVDEATYIAMSEDHVSEDEIVDKETVRKSQSVLSSVSKSIVNMFNMGASQSRKNFVRCFDNAGSLAEDVPNLKLQPKVHKDPAPGGHPQSRPVVTASSGISSRAGDILADILEPMVAVSLPSQEDRSTEEVISQLEEAERLIKESGLTGIMAGSLDVKALYPSLDQQGAGESVAKFVRESKLDIEGISWREVQIYLASSLDEHVPTCSQRDYGRWEGGQARPQTSWDRRHPIPWIQKQLPRRASGQTLTQTMT